MRIAVLSDTHARSPSPELQREYEEEMQWMDAVLHCGDHTGEEVWAYLSVHPAFYAVRGNMDGSWADDVLPAKRSLQLRGFRLGMLHGHGLGSGDPARKLPAIFSGEFDLLCFGHTHRRELRRKEGGPVLLNPGSFTSPRDAKGAGYAIIQIDADHGVHVRYKELAGS